MADQTTILVVDDEITNLEILSERLEDEGFDIISAESGDEALDILNTSEKEISLIILDWMMPGMSGIEFLKIIKDDSAKKDIPVIMQTAKAYSEDMVEGIDAGAAHYLTKPFSKKVLVSLVNSTLEQYSKTHKIGSEMEEQKKFMQGCAARMMKRQDEMLFDIKTYQIFNEFFMESPNSQTDEDLTTLLLDTVTKFSFTTAGEDEESRKLRCSVLLTGDTEIDISDRGMLSSIDKLILQKAMTSSQTIQNGTYTAIPSHTSRTAILIRNTPTNEKEAEKAIELATVLLERFEERLTHLEDQNNILKKNTDLEKKSGQIQKVVLSCSKELNHVNGTYQDMKMRHMELLEKIGEDIIASVPNLSDEQAMSIQTAAGKAMMKSMDLFTEDQITDQTFQITIQKLDELLSGEREENLEPGQMGDASQKEVDDLLASLGM